MSLAGIAKETLAIVAEGAYTSASGRRVDIRKLVDAAVAGTRLYTPEQAAALVNARVAQPAGAKPRVNLFGMTTARAAYELLSRGAAAVAALNFASAKNPGGGFLGGAKAQEEDLARCSALYTTQLTQRAYYDANRDCDSMLYTDHLIWSPSVPCFRAESSGHPLLDEPFLVSVLTSPAPNAGEALRRDPDAGGAIRATLERRAAQVLAVAAAHEARVLVLGAWGCGVFRNDPAAVADVFARLLVDDNARFRGAFDHVVFAIPARTSSERNFAAFRERFRAHFADPTAPAAY